MRRFESLGSAFACAKRGRYAADAEWDERDHPRTEGGQFAGKRKGALKVVSKSELHDFIEKHKNSKQNERVSLGKVSEAAKDRIKAATGIDVERVILDSDSIRHAYAKAEHHLLPNDLDDMKDIIETTTDISLSSQTTPSGNPVIIFRKQEPNGIILCEEYRAGKKELELQTAYRVKKESQPHGGIDSPPAYVRNATDQNALEKVNDAIASAAAFPPNTGRSDNLFTDEIVICGGNKVKSIFDIARGTVFDMATAVSAGRE